MVTYTDNVKTSAAALEDEIVYGLGLVLVDLGTRLAVDEDEMVCRELLVAKVGAGTRPVSTLERGSSILVRSRNGKRT